jgi:hypothetical protein
MYDAIAVIPAIGVVHNRLRYKVKWDDYLADFAAQVLGKRRVNGWWLERERREDVYMTFGKLDQQHTFIGRGIMGFSDKDDTDGLFGDQVDDVMDALSGLQVTNVWELSPPLLRVQDIRQFGSVLCHYAEIVVVAHREANL